MIKKIKMDEIVSLCKRRGFIFSNSSIYGGLQGIYDYGPLGVELKNNLKNSWWQSMIFERNDIEGLDSSTLTNKLVLKHSGHVDTFTDLLSDCKDCKHRMKKDINSSSKCEVCGSLNITQPRPFNLMFKTTIGPVDNSDSYAYLRPETAQGIFTNFKNVLDSTSKKLPFGIAQIGKAYRNEITPKNFIFRVREFEQMELEFFVKPDTDEKWHKYWIKKRKDWWIDQGLSEDNLRMIDQSPDELAHYSKATTDILYKFPHKFEELEGIANRTDYDLGSHSKKQKCLNLHSNVKQNDDSTAKLCIKSKEGVDVVPFVIEPSAGVDRGVLAILTESYTKESLDNGKSRIVLKLKKHLAPIKVAIIPLAKNKDKLVNLAQQIMDFLKQLKIGRIAFENHGNIGKAYRKNDEIGTPVCITVDHESLEDNCITVRNRDTMVQTRVELKKLKKYILDFFVETTDNPF